MNDVFLSDGEKGQIDGLVAHFVQNRHLFELFVEQFRGVISQPPVGSLYHSLRFRVKDPGHLRDKLVRKAVKCHELGRPFDITTANLFERVTDLAGVRLLHLHTSEFPKIHAALREVFDEHGYGVVEGPVARAWDDELREYFRSVGVETVDSERMYTSVHYVIQANRRTKLTAEIQVRTLAEELWGEVDHKINYPHPSPVLACREQIKVLARVTASCTRLVDAIFRTHDDSAIDVATAKREEIEPAQETQPNAVSSAGGGGSTR